MWNLPFSWRAPCCNIHCALPVRHALLHWSNCHLAPGTGRSRMLRIQICSQIDSDAHCKAAKTNPHCNQQLTCQLIRYMREQVYVRFAAHKYPLPAIAHESSWTLYQGAIFQYSCCQQRDARLNSRLHSLVVSYPLQCHPTFTDV